MISLALLLALAPAARAADIVELPRLEVGVEPSLVPALADPGSPSLALLEARAQTLLERKTPDEADRYLEALASPKASAADRLAAGALARLAVEPGLAGSVASLSPLLARLPYALSTGGAYRSLPTATRPAFVALALAARRDAAISALFDGSRPGLELSEAGMDGSRLKISGKKASRLRKNRLSDAFAHDALPGVSIEVYRQPLAHDEESPEIERSEAAAAALAKAGAAPRVLGRDVLFAWPLGDKPMRAASLRERVDGRSADELAAGGSISDGERQALLGAVTVAARAGYDVSGLPLSGVVLGETSLKGLPRAVIVDPGGLPALSASSWADHAVRAWLARFQSEVDAARRRTRMEMMMMR